MRALTIRNPYAAATVYGPKRVENRGNITRYRGPVALHAGAAWSAVGADDALVQAWHATRPGTTLPVVRDAGLYPMGAVLGVAMLTDSHKVTRDGDDQVTCCTDPWALSVLDGHLVRAHIVWGAVVALPEPIPAVGALGWWKLTGAAEQACLEALSVLT